MTLIDTHCHLTDEAFASDVEAAIMRAEERGVQQIVLPCVDEHDYWNVLKLADRYPGRLFPTIGIHPENMGEDIYRQLNDFYVALRVYYKRLVAIGEVGLDLHWDRSRLEEQQTLLREQVWWSLHYNLPLLLHIRDAMPEWLAMLPELASEAKRKRKRLRGIMHCYAGTAEEARTILSYGDFLFGVGGTLTYKKSLVPDVVRAIGLERLVLETDAPYLAPVPHRGKRNEPAYVADTAEALAAFLGTTVDEVAAVTSENARKLLRIP
jgi:TatD DNase family protein